MKRVVAGLLALVMVLALAACAKSKNEGGETTTTKKGGLQIEYGDVVLSDDEK